MPLLAGFLAFAFAAAALTVSASEPQSVTAAMTGWTGGDAIYLDVSNVPYWYSSWSDSVFTFYHGNDFKISDKVRPVEGKTIVVDGQTIPYLFEVDIPAGTWNSLTF